MLTMAYKNLKGEKYMQFIIDIINKIFSIYEQILAIFGIDLDLSVGIIGKETTTAAAEE